MQRHEAQGDDATITSKFDAFPRSAKDEDDITRRVKRVMATEDGQKILEYLTSITINSINPVGVDGNALMHLEGQRYIVSVLHRRNNHDAQA